nr:hypothetical protein [Kiritimatiellia bacterium]
MLKKIETTIFAALVAVCASPGFGAKVTFNGAEIEYTKAEVSYPDGEGGDIVFKFTNTAADAGELKLPSYAQAWILSVGGGGAGGSAQNNSRSNGGGGGGGGGGVVEAKDVVLEGGTYKITVGAGGAAGEAGVAAPGGNGQQSYIKYNGSVMSAFTAGGGGGGGGEGPGENGASGGGGSMVSGTLQSGGGVSSVGLGHAGGDGGYRNAAGGGGGAGGSGASVSAAGKSGAGGDGTNSWIEVSKTNPESPVCYGGGGGGGTLTSNNVGAGGAGGGGAGGGGMEGTDVKAEAGQKGTGGGGGGGSYSQAGAKGGDGVVIIRISEALASDPVRPNTTQELTYTGEALYAVKPSLALVVTGTYCATNIGEYTCSAKPKDGFTWQGGGTEEVSVSWQILPRKVQYPVAIPTAEYDGANRVAIDAPDEAFVFAPGSVTNATDAGTYTYTVSLKSDNYVWDGAAAGHEMDPHTVQWAISSQRVSVPAVLTGLVYDGTEKTAVDLSAAAFNSNAYRFVESPVYTHKETNASNYYFAVQLNNTSSASNYVWFIDGAETYGNQERAWSIAKAPNSIRTLEISGWKVSPSAVGETPKATSTWGTPQFSFAKSEDAIESEWEPWSETSKPNTAGLWWVRARVVEGDNWFGAERMASFVLWDNPASLFSDSIELAIANYSGTTALENFPLLVRISEASMPGFKYERAGMNGEAIAFICGDEMLDYDVDTWAVTGESLVWVKVPELKSSTKISMWWHLREGQETSGSRKERVWADYHGVWHFNEEIVASAAGTTKSVDATGNGYDASPKNYGTASWIDEMISADGIVGRSRQITRTKRSKGPRLEIENSAGLTLGTGFTMSGWFKELSAPTLSNDHNTKVLASRKTAANNTNGWLIEIYPSSTANQQDRRITGQGAGSTGVQATVLGTTAKRFYERGWAYFSGSYSGTTLGVAGGSSTDAYARGSASSAQAPTDNGQVISLGGFVGDSQSVQSFFGVFDEFRLCKLTRSADFQKAEYETVMKADFVKPGLVAIEGLKQNYWKTLPDVQPRQWENDGSFDPATLQISKGELADGSTVSNYFYSSKDPSRHFTDVAELNGEGLYHAVFVMADSEGYEPIKYEIDLRIIGHQPYNSLGGSAEGRVLLMNNDAGKKNKREAIEYQSWCDCVNDVPSLVDSDTVPTFWERFGDDNFSDSTYNRKAGTNWVLWTQNRERRLWHLDNCRHGNTFGKNDSSYCDGTPNMPSTQNFLPWSMTSRYISQHGMSAVFEAVANEVGQVLMRNVDDAAVYSPCYTNGVGTIYFDAVNGWVAGVTEKGYQIVVEVATETKDGEPLTDETSASPDDPDDAYGNIKEWVPFKMYPALVDGSSVTPPTEGVYTNNLDITAGQHLDKFYRIYVPVNLQRARFRIRRVSSTTAGTTLIPDTRLILIDNIFVSYPAMGADLSPLGDWDREKKGPQTLGWELATTVPFPHAGATNCHARAAVEYHKNAGVAGAEPSTFVSAAQMHYRWRYLNQSFTEWRSADLDPMNDFVSYQPLDLPSSVGDVEFWFETQLQAPFFSYADYSGLDVGMPCYKEEIVVVTNRCTLGETLPSSGKDWFFRLRNGESDWEALDVTITGDTLLDGTYPMSLIEDGMWRALVPLPTNATGTCTFRISGHNRTANGEKSLSGTTVVWGGQSASTNEVPCDGRLVELAEGGGEQSFEIDHN